MKKRILSILLVLCMLLPISAFALGQADGDACFNYLKNYLRTNGTYQSGVYSYEGVERSASDEGLEMVFHTVCSRHRCCAQNSYSSRSGLSRASARFA